MNEDDDSICQNVRGRKDMHNIHMNHIRSWIKIRQPISCIPQPNMLTAYLLAFCCTRLSFRHKAFLHGSQAHSHQELTEALPVLTADCWGRQQIPQQSWHSDNDYQELISPACSAAHFPRSLLAVPWARIGCLFINLQ